MANFVGTNGNDTLNGGVENDSMNGGLGNDSLTGGVGNDTMNGAEGNDTLGGGLGNDSMLGGSGIDMVNGEEGFDFINGGDGNDSLNGGADNDTVSGDAGSDEIDGGLGNDSLLGGDGNDSIYGDLGNDTMVGDAGDDLLYGEAGNDFMRGNLGNDTLYGGLGADTLNGGNGDDFLDGGVITDTFNYSDLNIVSYVGMEAGANVNLQTGIASDGSGGTDTLLNIMSVVGSDHDDTITGSTGWSFEIFDGGLGDDIIDGGALSTGNANRVVYASAAGAVTVDLAAGTADGEDGALGAEGSGHDILININHVTGSAHADTLLGSDSEFIESFIGRGGNDTIDGRGGLDTARYDFQVNANLGTHTASDGEGGTDTLANIEGLRGSNFNDTLTGGDEANEGEGKYEYFIGNGGNDIIDGGSGTDRADYTTSTLGVEVDLSDGWARDGVLVGGVEGEDSLSNIEWVRGSNHADILIGDDGNNQLEGMAGDDSMAGGAGNDTLIGAAGRDVFYFLPESSAGDTDTIEEFEVGDALVFEGLSFTELVTSTESLTVGQAMLSGETLLVRYAEGEEGLLRVELQHTIGNVIVADNFVITNGDEGTRLTYRALTTEGDDRGVLGGSTADLIDALGGDDYIDGLDGNDTIFGGAGDDTIVAGGSASDGADFFDGADDIDGGDGFDTVGYYFEGFETSLTFTSALVNGSGTQIDPVSGLADHLVSIEALEFSGGEGADRIIGGAEQNYFQGNGGNDTMTGGGGNDTFAWFGGTVQGNDVITDLSVGDALAVRDLSVSRFWSGDHSELAFGEFLLDTSTAGTTTLYFRVAEDDNGLASVTLAGNFDTSSFLVDNDAMGTRLVVREGATAGDNVLTGSDASEQLSALAGNDTISGNGGADTLTGGGGHDVFVFDPANDQEGETKLTDLGGDDALSFIGAAITTLFDASGPTELGEGEAMLQIGEGANTRLSVRVGDGVYTVRLNGVYTASQFTIEPAEEGSTLRVNASEAGDNVFGSWRSESIEGTAGNDTLMGFDGNDTLDGGAGSDNLQGGAGNDTYIFGSGDSIEGESKASAGGIDTVRASVDFSAAGIYVEYLTAATGTASIDLTGNSLANKLTGNDGANVLNGSTGADTMAGGKGNDTYYVDNGDDEISGESSASSGGIDTVVTSVDWSLSGYVENLKAATGTASIDLGGNSLANTLTGNDGANVLNGGTGADQMAGGKGNDTYYVDNGDDEISGESSASSGGIDTVIASVDWSLSGYVENLKAATGTAAIDLGGNSLANTLTGNDGKNVLNGGTGADKMTGGKGNDTYYVDNAGDNIDGESSASSGGVDSVYSSITWSIASDYVENLTLTGSASIDATGNQAANVITGNSGSNVLDGGAGADVLRGGAGNDLYIVDNAGDNIDGESSSASGGIDTVISSVSRSIASDYVEVLSLSGSANINGTGNQLANQLGGNAGKNALDGAAGNDKLYGGGGADQLTGGTGADRFEFAAASESTLSAFDRITDFTRGSDKIDLSHFDASSKSGHQDFTFIGSKAFSSNATGQLRFAVESGKVMLYGSTDADATAEFAVHVGGATTLSASDFSF